MSEVKQLSLKENMLWNSFGSIVNLACQWLITILIVRLGSGYEASGVFSLAMSIYNIFAPIAQYRMYTYQVSDVENENTTGEYLAFRFFTCGVALALCTGYSLFTCESGAIAAILLYAVYKSNFAGIGDAIDRWAQNVSLVIRGVIAAFQSLTGSTVTIKGELAKQLDASGLTPLVINISKAIYRVKSLFNGFWEGLDFSKFTELITPAMLRLMDAITSLGSAIGKLFGVDVSSEAASWENFGEILGSIVSVGFGLLGAAINAVVQGLSILKNLFDWVIAIINGDWTGALNAARGACDSLVSAVMGIADSLGIGDAIRAAFDDVVNFLNSIDLSECGRKILETLKNGILSAAGSIRDAVSGVFDKIGSLLPHSDAKEGPLSTLTLSGQKMMTTLAGGVALGAGTLQGTVSRSLEPIGQNIRTALTDAGGAALPALDTSNVTSSLKAIQSMTSRSLPIQTPEVLSLIHISEPTRH